MQIEMTINNITLKEEVTIDKMKKMRYNRKLKNIKERRNDCKSTNNKRTI